MSSGKLTPRQEWEQHWSRNKSLAEAILRHLFVGAQIQAIFFGNELGVVIQDDPDDDSRETQARSAARPKGEVYLALTQQWTVFESAPLDLVERDHELALAISPVENEDQIRLILAIRQDPIDDVRLGKDHPHLIITFRSGRVLLMDGWQSSYETWHVTVHCGDPDEHWRVIACPDDRLYMEAPATFPEVLRYSESEG